MHGNENVLCSFIAIVMRQPRINTVVLTAFTNSECPIHIIIKELKMGVMTSYVMNPHEGYYCLLSWVITIRNLPFSGYSRSEVKKACPDCDLDESREDGIYNLVVKNVRLGTDQDYECQVSPGKSGTTTPLRAKAHITILGRNCSVLLIRLSAPL